MFYCHICCLGSFMEDFLYNVKIRESILIGYFTRHLQRLVKFWQRRKKWEVDSASKLREQSGFTVSWKYCLNLCSLRRLKGAAKKFKQIFLRLLVFGRCLKWVFQVCLRRFSVGRDSLEVKKIIKVNFLRIIAATSWRFYEWVGVFLEKRPRDVFRCTLSLVAVPKWFHSGFLCLYSSKRWQSDSRYNIDNELNGIKDFLKEKQFFLYWIRYRYQSKTCVEYFEQVIHKSLIKSTNRLFSK